MSQNLSQGLSPEAMLALAELLRSFPQLQSFLGRDAREQITVREVVDDYLADARHELAENSLTNRKMFIDDLVESLGHLQMSELQPIHLTNWVNDHDGWKSRHTRHGANSAIQRVFNWAVKMRKIRENPFRGVSFRKGRPQREMTTAEYMALLRCSDPLFRRVLVFLRYTGARPGELCKLKWSDIDFDRSVATLFDHKTADTTRDRRPRVIPLSPPVVKLLLFIKNHPHRPRSGRNVPWLSPDASIKVIRDVLSDGPVPAKEFRRRLREAGVPVHDIYQHCRTAGAAKRKIGPPGEGYWAWELGRPEDTGLIVRPRRRGYYAHVWKDGREIQVKLADDLDTARRKLENNDLRAEPRRRPLSPSACVGIVRRVLSGGPVPAKEFRRRLSQAQVPLSGIYRHCRVAGAICRKTCGAGGYWVWELASETAGHGEQVAVLERALPTVERPPVPATVSRRRPAPAIGRQRPRKPDQVDAEHVFLTSLGTPWTKGRLSNRMQRAKDKAGLDPGCRLYGLRHKFGSDCIRAGVALKVLSEAMGHTTTIMTEHYCHIAGDHSLQVEAVSKLLSQHKGPDLQKVISAWTHLSAEVKRQILATAEANRPKQG